MTTITYRSGCLAADSLVTSGRARCGTITKVWKTDDGSLWAVCGKMAYIEACKAWAAGDRLAAPPKMDESAFVHVTPDGRVRECWGDGWCESLADFFAWGSGDEFAIGAMGMGADAATAVEVAARFDTATGGEITVLTLA